MSKWWWILTAGLAAIAGGAALFWFLWFYPIFLKPNTTQASNPFTLDIPTGQTLAGLLSQLEEQGILHDKGTFRQCALRLNLDTRIKPGRYRLTPGWNNLQLVRHLRSGQQVPVRLIINNIRTLEELAGRLSTQIEPDSVTLLRGLLDGDRSLDTLYFDDETLLCLFLPNTYEVWWSVTPAQLLERMKREYRKFWTAERQAQAEQLGMDPLQVCVLASIVEKETRVRQEMSTIAGVYLNRLQTGMLLQADPTVVFALRAFDKERILTRDLEVDSPYNTYRYPGLPPGPITLPELHTLDAVLRAEKHDYLFFCARPDNSGAHAFAKTHNAHIINARKFRRWLDQRGIFQ